MKLFSSIIFFLSISPLVWAETLPPRIEINYKITSALGDGELSEVLEISQNETVSRYRITSHARTVGMLELIKPGQITRESRGMITDAGLLPQQFTDQRNNHPPSIARFDWEKDALLMQHHAEKKEVSLQSGTQDRLSLPYSFMFSATLPQTKITLHETDGRVVTTADYSVHQEKLDTPLGRLDTVVLTRQPKKEDNIERKIWLATRYHLLPVRIVAQEENGLDLEQIVTAINYAKKPKAIQPEQLTENSQ